MKKRFALVLMVMLTIVTFFSLSFAANQELKIGVASWMLTKFPMKEAVAQFEKSHPGVNVKLEALSAEFTTSIIPSLRTDNPPYDLLMPYSGGDAAPFAALGLLAPWDNVFNNPDFQVNGHELSKSDFVQGFLQDSYFNDQVLSLPVFGEVMALTERKDLLAKAGITSLPTSLDQLATDCTQVNTPFVAGFSAELSRGRNTLTALFGIAQSMGGSILDSNGHFNLLAPTTVKAMQYLVGLNTTQKCAQSESTDKWDASRTAYLGGHVAQFYAWASWGMQGILPKPVFGDNAVVVGALPGAAENGTIDYAGGAIVPKTGNVKLAQEFTVELVESKSFQQWSATHYGKSPVLTENYAGLPAMWDGIAAMTKTGASMPSFLNYTQMTNIFQKEFTLAWNGKITPQAALEATSKQIDSLY